jgi:hypothetical protein
MGAFFAASSCCKARNAGLFAAKEWKITPSQSALANCL